MLERRQNVQAAPAAASRLPVVYTVGKVASTAIAKAIREAGRQVYHVHTLRTDRLRNLAQRYLDRGELPKPWICEAMAWQKHLRRPKQCFYITLVREPIGRNISAFFENLESKAGPNALSKSAEELCDIFIKRQSHDHVHTWFDSEFSHELGIDVYSEKFDLTDRYTRLSSAPVLILRVDCDDAIKSREISKALGFTVEVTRHHDSAAKAYADKYAEFKRIARFPADFLDYAYGTKYSKHFWSEDELAGYRKAWS